MINYKLKVSVIIPCYNEKDTIRLIFEKVKASEVFNKEIIIVDDCSTDGSDTVINEISKDDPSLKTVFHKENQGKGAAIKSGLKSSTGDLILIQDADLEYDPNEYSILIDPILKGKADVVYGSRFTSGKNARVLYFWHRFGNFVITLLSNLFTNLNLTDIETCYKVFKSEIIKKINIEEERFGFEPEITAKISKLNCRIYEVGISYYGRTYGEGKKITWKDGFRAIYCIIKYNCFR